MPKNDVGQYVNCKQNANVGSLGLFAGIRLHFVGSPAVIYLCVCVGTTTNDNFRRQVLCGADLFKQKRSKYILNRYTFLITRCGYRRRRHRRRRHRRRHRRRCGRRRLRGCVCVCGCVLSLVRLLARLQISVTVSPPAIFFWLYGSPVCHKKTP